MGYPMLIAMQEAGFDARGYDIRSASDFPLTNSITNDPEKFAETLRVLLIVVRDQAETEQVLFGDQAFVRRAAHLQWIVICSTLSPRYVRSLRDRIPNHIRLVDAPMSGAEVAAQQKRLSFMLGGSIGDLDHLHPLFTAMGRHFHRMGGYGSGMVAKVLNNLLAASNTAMTRLVLDWADQEGLDEQALLALIDTSSGQNWFASNFSEIEFARDGMACDNTIGILAKDVESALDAAPEGAITVLPDAIRSAIMSLKPRG